MSFNITSPVKVVNSSANVDVLYGTYASVIEACAGVPLSLREKSRTVGIIVNGSSVEYWWKSGTTDADLVLKNTSSSGTPVEIVNDVTTGGTAKALSAEMGKALYNGKVDKDSNGRLLTSGEATIIQDVQNKEPISNKSNNVISDLTSTTKYPSVKAIVDWVLINAQGVNFLGTAIPTTDLTGTGKAFWIAITPGTYTQGGSVSENSIAVITRINGVFSISQTTLDLTLYQKITDNIKSGATGKNRLNRSFIKDGFYINGGGNKEVTSDWSVVEKLPIFPNTTYTISGVDPTGIDKYLVWHDINGNLLAPPETAINASPKIVTSPSTACFVSFSIKNATNSVSSYDNAQIEVGSIATAYEAYYINEDYIKAIGEFKLLASFFQEHSTIAIYKKNEIVVSDSKIFRSLKSENSSILTDDLSWEWISPDLIQSLYKSGATGKNRLNRSFIKDSFFINSSGNKDVTSNWSMVEKLPILPNTTYAISGVDPTGIDKYLVWHDINGNLIAPPETAINASPKIVTSPSTACFVSFSIKNATNSVSSYDNAQIEVGSIATAYEAYYINEDYINYLNGFKLSAAFFQDYNITSVYKKHEIVVSDGRIYKSLKSLNTSVLSDELSWLAIGSSSANGASVDNINATKRFFNSRRKPTFSFVFDGTKQTDQLAFNVLKEYGFIANYAVLPSALTDANKPIYENAYKKGSSIIAYPSSGGLMNTDSRTNADVDAVMVASKTALRNLGFKVSGWQTTGSTMHIKYFPQVVKNFGYAFTDLNAGAYNETVDPLKLSRFGLESAFNSLGINGVKARVDTAIANNELLVFYAHEIPSIYLKPDGITPFMTESDLRELLAYLKLKVDDNQCFVLPTDEAVEQYYKNPFA